MAPVAGAEAAVQEDGGAMPVAGGAPVVAAEQENHNEVLHDNELEGDDDDEEEAEDDEGEGDFDDDDDDDLNQLLDAALLMPVLALDDPRRMDLTDDERRRALLIKAAIESHPEIDNLTDFWYAQLALVDRDDVEAAVDRAMHLQEFRHEYGIRDSFLDGVGTFAGLMKLFPRHFLSFSYVHRDGNYVFIYDITQFDMTVLSNPEKLRTWLSGAYYVCNILNPDMEAIRRGSINIAECEGYNWNSGMNFGAVRKIWTEIIVPYPLHFHQIKSFHTGMFGNLLFSLLKRFLPRHWQTRIQMGCQFDGRLDTFYLVPTVESANARMLHRMSDNLRMRYENEQSFTLRIIEN